MKEVNVGALIRLKGARPHLTAQQYRTLRRTLHNIAFLLFWAVVLSVFYLVTLAVLIVFILLA